jgi:hypothetical protein
MVGFAKLFPRCRQTIKIKHRKLNLLEKNKPLGLISIRIREREKWVFVTPTYEEFT